jgi:hypothetical protein
MPRVLTLNRRIAKDDAVLQSHHGPGPAFDCPMILLDDAIAVVSNSIAEFSHGRLNATEPPRALPWLK